MCHSLLAHRNAAAAARGDGSWWPAIQPQQIGNNAYVARSTVMFDGSVICAAKTRMDDVGTIFVLAKSLIPAVITVASKSSNEVGDNQSRLAWNCITKVP